MVKFSDGRYAQNYIKIESKIIRSYREEQFLYNFLNKFSFNFEPQATTEIVPSYFLTVTLLLNSLARKKSQPQETISKESRSFFAVR